MRSGCRGSASSRANPDVSIPLDLSGLLRSEVSLIAGLRTGYFVDPARQSWMDYIDAENAGVPNKWQVFIDPESVDIDVFDIADIIGDLLEDAIDAAVDTLLGFLPGWARDLVKAILGPLVDLVRDVLDLPDDIEEWLSDLLGTSLGLLDVIVTAVLDHFLAEPVFEFEDPYPILDAAGGLIPVKIPVADFDVHVTDGDWSSRPTSARKEHPHDQHEPLDPDRPRQRRPDPARFSGAPRTRARRVPRRGARRRTAGRRLRLRGGEAGPAAARRRRRGARRAG